jgi:hypothetical protein
MLRTYVARLSFVALAIFFSAYHGSKGLVLAGDSYTYLRWSEALFDSQFDLARWLIEGGSVWLQKLFYLFFVAGLGVVKSFGGESWATVALVVHIILLITTLYLWGLVLHTLNISAPWIALFYLLHLVSVDHLTWPRYLLTDTLYAAELALTVLLALKFARQRSFGLSALLALSLCLLGLTRPTAAPIIFSVSFWVVLVQYSNQVRCRGSLIAVVMAFCFGLVLVTGAIYGRNGEIADGILGFAARGILAGEVINDRPSTWAAPPTSVVEVAYLIIHRFVAFFSITHENFSLMHNGLNSLLSAFILPGIAAYWFLGRSQAACFAEKARFGLLVGLVVVFVALFHSFILIDYDWRYRYPLIDPLLALATVGFASWFKSKAKTTFRAPWLSRTP